MLYLLGLTLSLSSPQVSPAKIVKGMTISCQTYGQEWGSDAFGQELDRLKSMGVNWISIHPYAQVTHDGFIIPSHGHPTPDWLTRPVAEVKKRKMFFMMKPHLAYWGSGFSWRGDITFHGQAKTRFKNQYRQWILSLIESIPTVDAFVVGTEIDQLTRDVPYWRELIAQVRMRTQAKLTFASNWSDFEKLPFWDALDAIGVQAYFPLHSGDALPTRNALKKAWIPIIETLRKQSLKYGKPVIFTEIGYDANLDAATKPWASAQTSAAGRALQEQLIGVALEVLEREKVWLRGAFWWKWFAGPANREDFSIDRPKTREIIKNAWRNPGDKK